jgi:hypothetical protein
VGVGGLIHSARWMKESRTWWHGHDVWRGSHASGVRSGGGCTPAYRQRPERVERRGAWKQGEKGDPARVVDTWAGPAGRAAYGPAVLGLARKHGAFLY